MKHLAFSFDFSWFITVPGMLITGGVLLLIIALIIFITTNGKGKQKLENMENWDLEEDTKVEDQVEEKVEVSPSNEKEEVPSSLVEKDKESFRFIMPEAQPVLEEANEVEPEEEELPKEEVKNEEEVTVVPPVISSIPIEEAPVEIEEKEEPKVAIYGGVSPIVPNIKQEKTEEKHQIYGGANPMDATQSIPVVKEHHGYVSQMEEAKNKQKKNPSSLDQLANFEPTMESLPSQKVDDKKDDVEMLDF